MCSKPEDPVEYLESCLQKVKELGGCDKVKWDTFVSQEKKTLPPLNGGQSRRSFLRNVMPENSNFPYRRYDRLPPIHQFSIESDTDLSETAELIEEYEVFDPTRPRPKIILVIGMRKEAKFVDYNGNGYPWPCVERQSRRYAGENIEGWIHGSLHRTKGDDAMTTLALICTPDLVVFLACANQRLKERLLKRAEQQGRPDDNMKATQRRLMNFKQNAAPLVKYFQEKGLIMTFDADRDEDEVFYDISVAVDSKLFPNKEAAAGSGDLDPLMMLDTGEIIDTGSDYEDQDFIPGLILINEGLCSVSFPDLIDQQDKHGVKEPTPLQALMPPGSLLLLAGGWGGIPHEPCGIPQREVTFDANTCGILEMSVVNQSTGDEARIIIAIDKGCLNEEHIELIVKKGNK
ncbi:PREDICTED: adenylate kinase isoenzyme 5-like [Galeopterus variegatus]|uniref:Adenylate kinase isoenzyme 5-like n=1 Tax=Galeopterus variegatus TaxID=482537 RepID=A0ABM0QB25_GALVR|nr:PREDICTED: adenylate kinase isoenzyme 5-like [Galeopterus variegatus]